MKKNLIAEVGRSDAVGRPILYGTTDEFLRSFAISDLSELTPLEDYIIDELENNINEE